MPILNRYKFGGKQRLSSFFVLFSYDGEFRQVFQYLRDIIGSQRRRNADSVEQKGDYLMKLEIIRHFDKLGRIVIPIDFRRSMGVTEDTEILVTVNDEGILLKKRDTEDDTDFVQSELNACAPI